MTGMAAVKRYDEISRIGRRSLSAAPAEYDWEMMLATGRNNYGNPEQCIQNIRNAMKNYYFDTLTTTFNFGGYSARRNHEIHAFFRQRSHAGVSLDSE